MNNEGRWIYKQEKRKPLQTLAIIPRLHFYTPTQSLTTNLQMEWKVSNFNAENPLNRF